MARTSPLVRLSTTMRWYWRRLRDLSTVRIGVDEGAALRDGPREQECLHWAGGGLELHGWFLPPPEPDRPRRSHQGEPMAHQIERSSRCCRGR